MRAKALGEEAPDGMRGERVEDVIARIGALLGGEDACDAGEEVVDDALDLVRRVGGSVRHEVKGRRGRQLLSRTCRCIGSPRRIDAHTTAARS